MSIEAAKYHVRAMLSRGYTAEDADSEACMGASYPHGGYEICHGRITAPYPGGETYKFRDIVEAIAADDRQPSLF